MNNSGRLPPASEVAHTMDFRDTAYFQIAGRELPTTEEVIDKWQSTGKPRVVIYEELGLVVKFGYAPHVSVAEVFTLQFVKQTYRNNEVPVPEVFGWRFDRDAYGSERLFIYMSLVPGETVLELWPSLTVEDKESICLQLKKMVDSMRSTVPPSPPSLGSVGGGPIRDRFLQDFPEEAGPLPDIKSFNNHISFMSTPSWAPMSLRKVPEEYRAALPDDCGICFTHGDISPNNIMVVGAPGSGSISVSGLIDWEQSGWYPEYWEYCKMHLSIGYNHGWREEGWVEKVAAPYEDQFVVLGEYWLWRAFP